MSPPREPPRGPETTLSGVVERILWLDEETHFTIAELAPEAGEKVIILGNMTGLQCGETVDVSGHWERHPSHGPQLRVRTFSSRLPSSVHGIRKYLGSGLIKGIGKTYADKIVARFGVRTFDIISNQSGRLREVDGIGPGRAKAIKAAWDDQKALREVMVFLQTYGVTNSLCIRIVKAYGQDAKKVLTTEPYRVCREVEGVGFKTADKIARNLGLPTAGPQRVDAGILHTLEELEGEGHSAFPDEGLLEKATELLEVDKTIVHDRLRKRAPRAAPPPREGREVHRRLDPAFPRHAVRPADHHRGQGRRMGPDPRRLRLLARAGGRRDDGAAEQGHRPHRRPRYG